MANKRRPQGDGSIRKRKDGRWECRIVIGHKKDGSPMRKSLFGKTQKEALKLLHQMIDLYCDVDLTEECKMTVGEWMDKWLDEYMMFTLRENTIYGYRMMIENQIKRFIGKKPLASLTTTEVQKFYNTIKRKGRINKHPLMGYELADTMVRKVHMLLHQALDVAVRERYIVRNPTTGTTIPKKTYIEKQVLCDSQLERFMEAIKREPYWNDFFYVEIMTGLRRGEICGLKWTDINFDDGTITIKRTVSAKHGGGIRIGDTKTDAGTRTIVLPPSVLTLLKGKERITQWIFPHTLNPEEPLHPGTAYGKLKAILKREGLPLIRFHDLRHTFATQAMQGGVDAKTLSGILGHTDASFTLDTYTNVTSDMQRNASKVVNNMMQQFLTIGENDGK